MFGTEDEYNRAVRGASIHALEEEESSFASIIKSVVVAGVVASSAYFGFNYYTSITKDKSELLAEISSNPTAVMGATHSAEDDYILALNNMEVEPLVEVENSSVTSQESLREAISSIVEDSVVEADSEYTQELIKEIEDESAVKAKSRVVIVQKGDTLASLSKKYYGDEMKYEKIIASNSDIIDNDGKIYAGEKIYLPY